MKKNVIAILLSVSLIAGSFGAAPLYAAEVTAQEAESEQDLASVPSEEESPAAEEEETVADPSSECADEHEVENEPVEEEEQNASGETEEIDEESSAELNENGTVEEEVLSGEENADDVTIAEPESTEVSSKPEIGSAVPIDATAEPVSATVEHDTNNNSFLLTEPSGNKLATGSCGKNGDNLTWTVYDDGVLEISGSGEMKDYTVRGGGGPWSAYNEYINSIVICDGVESIGSSFYYKLSNISSLFCTSTLKHIDNDAFWGLKIESIYFDGSISEWMFKEWGGSFYWAEYNLYVKNHQNYELVSDLSGLSGVTSIPSYAFTGCNSLTSVVIPDEVTEIGDYAFRNCSSILEMTLADSVQEIGNYSFESCTSIQNTVITDNVTTIGDFAFYDCSSMISIQFPEAVTLGNNVINIGMVQEIRGYDGSDVYREFVINKKSYAEYSWVSLGKATKGKCGDNIEWNLKNGILSLTGTGDMYDEQLWEGYDVDYVLISEGITGIGERSFSGLNMEEVQLPDTITSIGEYAFLYCDSLKSIYLPGQIKEISRGAFWACKKLEAVELPESLEVISEYAFLQCGITSIVIPDSVRRIEAHAFDCCTNLEEITLSESLEYIGNSAFYDTNPSSIVLPDSITYIGEKCFEYCSNLTEIEIPSSVNEIGNEAFFWTGITKAYYKGTIDDFVKSGISYYTLKRDYYNQISTYVYLYCLGEDGEYYLVEDLELSKDVTVIPESKFSDCMQIKSVNLPLNLKSIEGNSFNNCNGLTNISISEGVETIRYGAFSNCRNLSRIKLPASLVTIEDQQFDATLITLIVYENSIAHKYAVDNNLKYEINTEEIKTENVTLSDKEIMIEIGESTQLEAEILPLSATNKLLEWTTSNKSIAYVTQSGVVVGVKAGTATITVSTANGKVDSCVVTVMKVIPLTGISLPELMEIAYGKESDVLLSYEPSATTDDRTASWQSSDTDIFTVSDDGTVTPTGIGTATLTATVGEFSATSEITVVKGTPEYETPEQIDARCGQTLEELQLPDGFEWENPGENVGNPGKNQHKVTYVPKDAEHYNSVGDITVEVNVEHDFSEEWSQSPDSHWHECVCGERADEDGHMFGEWEITEEPTCSGLGERTMTCSECGYVEHETIDPKGHDWYSDYTVDVEATCTESGEKSIYCKTCGEKNEESTVEIPALGHVYAEKVIQPTCTQGGFTMHICGRCGDYYEDNETAPTGHTFTDWIIDHDSTCTEEGIQHRECTDCGYIETKGINKKEHSFDTEFTVDKEPTCMTDGSRSYHCTSEGCTATTGSEVIPATGHDYGEWEVTREATCTESGEMQRTCATCDETEIVEYGARGHVWLKTHTVDREATCTEEGSESIRCAVCDEIKEGSEHVIPAAGHALTHVEEVPATYESEGNIEFYWCDTCGKIFSDESCEQELSEDETVIPKMDRIPVKIVSQPADIEVAAGEQAKFKVAAEGSDLSYQWQYTLNGSYWSNCKGAGYDTDTFSFAMDRKYAGRQYRCILTSGDEKVTSDAAALRLKETNKITLQPADVNAAIGETVAFHVEATGKELSYKWQYSVNGTYWGNCTGSSYNTDTFSFAMQERFDGRQYRCVVTADGNKLISNAVSAILKQAGEIVEQPQDQKAGVGENVSFHVGFSGDNPEYQWQYSLNGSYWSNCKGNSYNLDTFSFVMQEKFDGRQYRCMVTAGGMTYTSDIVTVRIGENEMITSQPEDVALAVGENASFHVGTTVSGVTYQWQWSSDGKTWKNCTGAGYNTDTFSFATQTRFSGRRYRCMVTDGAKTEYSDGGLLTVTK